jgi:predicted phosphohydrolase
MPACDAIATRELLNDFTSIFVKDSKIVSGARRLRTGDVTELHLQAIEALKNSIKAARAAKQPLIVVTHHKPFIDDAAAPRLGYEVDMTELMTMKKSPIVLWVYGHTHSSRNARLPGSEVRVYSNSLGYPYERNTRFDPKDSVVIQPKV